MNGDGTRALRPQYCYSYINYSTPWYSFLVVFAAKILKTERPTNGISQVPLILRNTSTCTVEACKLYSTSLHIIIRALVQPKVGTTQILALCNFGTAAGPVIVSAANECHSSSGALVIRNTRKRKDYVILFHRRRASHDCRRRFERSWNEKRDYNTHIHNVLVSINFSLFFLFFFYSYSHLFVLSSYMINCLIEYSSVT